MKNLIYLLIVSFSLLSCGGSGGDEPNPPNPEPTNNKPTTPLNTSPINDLLCIDNSLAFEWNASTDPDGDAISYQLQVATNNQFNENLHTLNNISSTNTQLSLDTGVAYYWRVKAIDSKNASSDYSSVFQFYTEGDGVSNHVPFAPNVVTPKLNQLIQTNTTQLEWTASDVDNDPLTYDVFFGTVNPPTTKVAQNLSTNTFDATLNSSTPHYWKIVVNDGKGGISIGQIWNFKTD